jgi:hypothetical protein
MNTRTPGATEPERPLEGRSPHPSAIERAQHYQDLARGHRDEETFWLCRASYFGRLAARSRHNRRAPAAA